MKKTLIFLLVLLLIAVLPLSGCTKKEEATVPGKPATVFVVANTANAQMPNFESPLVQDTVVDCAMRYGYLSVINADGAPALFDDWDLDIEERFKAAAPERLALDARSKATSILSAMRSVAADDPEVDFLQGIIMASRVLSGLDENYTSRTIIVLGSGLSTSSGDLNFQNNIISAEPEVVADLLEEREALPDLNGVTVVFQGIGDTAAPQEDLSAAHRKKLTAIWKEIIVRSGGEFVANDFLSLEPAQNTELPKVSVVELPAVEPIAFDPIVPVEANEEIIWELPETQLAFVSDSAEYVDPEAAEAVLLPIAEALAETDMHVALIGCVAGDETTAFGKDLSLVRACAVRDSLVSMEPALEERISTVGTGCDNPWHIRGLGTDTPQAAQNRRVVLMEYSNAQKLLGEDVLPDLEN